MLKSYDELFAEIEARKADLELRMPTESDAIQALYAAVERLKHLGWNNPDYCPKDGSLFSVIEPGSTGIHKCAYVGTWPTGRFNIFDGDIWVARPILFRPRKESDPNVDLGSCLQRLGD